MKDWRKGEGVGESSIVEGGVGWWDWWVRQKLRHMAHGLFCQDCRIHVAVQGGTGVYKREAFIPPLRLVETITPTDVL